MNHALVTIAIPFATAKAPAVIRVLDELGNPAGEAARAGLDASGVIHFMSVSAVPDTASGIAHIFIELSADGAPNDAIDAVCAAIGPTLTRAFEVAEVNPKARPPAKVLRRHTLNVGPGFGQSTGLCFDGSAFFSVERIHDEERLAAKIMTHMGETLSSSALDATEKLQLVRNWLWSQGEKWAFGAEPAPFLTPGGLDSIPARIGSGLVALLQYLWWLFPLAALVGVLGFNTWRHAGFAAAVWSGLWIAVGFFVLALGLILGLAVWRLRRLESADQVDDTPPDAAKVEAILRHENIGAQNLLAAVSVMKVGWFRRVVLRLAFLIARQDVATVFRAGFLRDIGVIHFARWALIPGTDKLMFWSNFSDGWESYLEDFINKAGDGLTAVWTNTQGFPRTSWLIVGGAADGDRFRRWARRQQYPVSFWYSAYPDLKMNRIRRNAAIRQGISGARTIPQAENWVNIFGSEPRPPFMLQKPEVPTLVLGGLKRQRFSTCLIVRLPQDQQAGEHWLRVIEPMVTFGEAKRLTEANSIAFTAHGLTRLGVSAEDMDTFPTPFQNGMTSPGRSRAIGDLGAHAPEHWLWGQADETDAAVLLFATEAEILARNIKTISDSLAEAGGAVLFEQRMTDRPADPDAQVIEPFGFADGISQPIMRDSPRARIDANAEHVVEAGEFLLGYPDNTGFMPSTPTIQAMHDPGCVLTESGTLTTGVEASFQGGGSDGRRDFGRNGSFLVIRHLEQDVDRFHAFSAKTATSLLAEPACPFQGTDPKALGALIEAKMLGRWQNGRSLVRHVFPEDGHGVDNDFAFQREDPQGFACPFGAHIRRANPRDSIDTSSAAQLALSNRHRILRIGRPYDQAPGGKPGLVFMCLNADIERQFEFLQQTWILGSAFHHLGNERDPLLGHNDGTGCFTIPTREGPVRIEGLPDFVTVRGGGYFFMPGRKSLRWLASDKVAAPVDSLPKAAAPIAGH